MNNKFIFNSKILICDDSPSMVDALSEILNQIGFVDVEVCCNGEDGLLLAKQYAQVNNPFDLIFLDVNMPKKNGVELLKELRIMDYYKKTPIIMISTNAEKNMIISCIMEGSTEYIIKPFQNEIVKEKIMKRFKL